VGELLGPELLAKYARGLGLGRKSGLPEELHEAPGLVPDAGWKRMYSKWGKWGRGDTLNTAIGQGFLLVTPLQIAMMTAFVANGGTLLEPQLVSHRRNADGTMAWQAPIVTRETVPVSTSTIQLVQNAMRLVVDHPSGTGRRIKTEGLSIAGKTGTAEHYRKPSDAWFCCYAPYEAPEIAIAVVVESGGHGGETAAPLAEQLLHHYFRDRLEQIEGKVSAL
jgi:penicillin-binding protein 2